MQIGGSQFGGLLSPIHINEGRNATHPGPPNQVPRAAHLGHLVLAWWVHWGGVVEKSRKVPGNLLVKSFLNFYTGVELELQKWLDTVPWYAVGGVELIDDLV